MISFKNFFGLETGDRLSDEKTIWLFRENFNKCKRLYFNVYAQIK